MEICLKLLNASKQNDTDLVVVPFYGSGSEVVACKRLGLPFITFDINENYVELAKTRLIEDDEVSRNNDGASTSGTHSKESLSNTEA